jgi:hypothetical protein
MNSMNSDDLICISRQGLELGKLSVGEAGELLRIGFLLPTDECWTRASAEHRRLCELNSLPAGDRPGWLKQAKTSMVATTSAVMERAGKITGQVTESIRRRRSVIGGATTKVLEDYAPRLRERVAAQMQTMVQTTKEALEDEVFLRKLFGAVYDCLPKPVYRFVSERAFIAYCLKHRRKLLR